MIDKKLILNIDYLMLASIFALSLLGILAIYGATSAEGSYFYKRQFLWLLIGLAVMVPLILIDYMYIERLAYPILAISAITLILVFIVGHRVGGAQRWLSLGFASFQPSEFAKVAFIIALAKHLSTITIPRRGLNLKQLIGPAVILLIPFGLIVKQPDLGTGLIFVFVFLTMMLVVKVRRRIIIGATVALAAMMPLAWISLKGYQKARLLSFFDPSKDPLGSGYHVLQSKIAIGSGGLTGVGFKSSTQASLMFLPEHHTDFIFPVIAEEWGFIGAMVLLVLFITLLMRGLTTAYNAKDRFGCLLAVGLTALIFWHMTINIAMVMGLLPVVGVPLPFISYGGSFLLTALSASAILLNISMRRFVLR